MFKIKNFDKWEVSKDTFGSGASEKLWLVNTKTGQKGIFKFPKVRNDGTITGEFWAEKLASEIAKLVGIKCSNVDMGIYNRETWIDEL